jgi:spectrin beta
MEHIFFKNYCPTHQFITLLCLNLQINLEQAENLIKRHEAFLTTMEANDDKINNVVQFASRLCDEGHFAGWWHNI